MFEGQKDLLGSHRPDQLSPAAERECHRLEGNILNARHTHTHTQHVFTHRYAAAIFLIRTKRRLMIIIDDLSFWPGWML